MIRFPPAALRYGVAFVFLLYGFAKLLGSQFTILDSELDRPMGQVSGIWLTWYYFGFSAVYGNLIGVAQIGGALLLTFRRTTLLGIGLLLPITTNIVLVDLFYGVDLSGTLMAVLMWVCLLAMLRYYREPLLRLFRDAAPPGTFATHARRLGSWGVRLGMVLVTGVFIYWVANYNNRSPTPIDGTWDLVAEEGGGAGADQPQRIYFEHNRAHLVIFRFQDHSTAHHFEVDPTSGTIAMWDQWLQKGPALFQGTYRLDGERLELRGRFADEPGEVNLRLRRVYLARGGRPPVVPNPPTRAAN